MKHIKIFYYSISVVLFILFIFPFIYITKYTFPTIDDFCRASLTSSNYFTVVSDWYLYLNGRFFNAIITSLPVFEIFLYRLILITQFFLLGGAIFYFVRTTLSIYEFLNINYTSIFLTSLFLIAIIASAPSLYELFYWYSSVTGYLITFLLFVIFFRFIIKEHYNLKSNYILIAVVIVGINGNHELLIGLTNFLLLLVLIRKYLQDKVLKTPLLILNIVSWVSSIAVVFAPGSSTRQEHFIYGGNLIGSLKVAVFYGAKFIIESFINFPLIFFYIFLFLFIYRLSKSSNSNRFLNPIYLSGVSYISLISIFFILYYATGLFQVREGRIGNLAGMVTFIFISFNICNFAVFLRNKKIYKIFDSRFLSALSLLLFLFPLLVINKNYVAVKNDLVNNSFEKYEQEVLQRIAFLKATKRERVILEPIKGTLFLGSGDAALYLDEQIMTCYRSYVSQNFNSGIKDIKIKKPPQLK